MFLTLLNDDFEAISILEKFKSLLWVDKYWTHGDLTIQVTPSDDLLAQIEGATYARLAESDRLMIIEDLIIDHDRDGSGKMEVKGRSLESILDRRIVWEPTFVDGFMQDGIEAMLNDNLISPTDTARQIPNFVFLASTDPLITGLSINTQFRGETLLAAISAMCRAKQVGFKVVLNSNNEFEFSLYAGVDRSYNQNEEQFVVFSNKFDNLNKTSYVQTSKFQKTVILVGGEQGVGNARTTTIVEAIGGSLSGLNRKETYLEPPIQRNLGNGQILSEEDYILQLQGRGTEDLAQKVFVTAFDGEIDQVQFALGVDFFLGDIVQLEDSYGHGAMSRVTEIAYSHDSSGESIFPSFTTKTSDHLLNALSIKTQPVIVGAPTCAAI